MMVIKIMLLNQPDGQHGKHLHEVVNLHQGTGKKKTHRKWKPVCVSRQDDEYCKILRSSQIDL